MLLLVVGRFISLIRGQILKILQSTSCRIELLFRCCLNQLSLANLPWVGSIRDVNLAGTFFTWNGVFWWILSGIFVYILARKMLDFPPEVAIWWTLKVYFWEVGPVVTRSELWGWWARVQDLQTRKFWIFLLETACYSELNKSIPLVHCTIQRIV